MVAITVILAAVIGTFVLGIGENQETTPSASWDWDYSSANGTAANVTHNGGDTFNDENTGDVRAGEQGGTLNTWSLPIEAGDQRVAKCDGGTCDSGVKLIIVWEANGGGRTSTVGSYTIP